MPDATGLELIAHDLRDADGESVLGTAFMHGRATVIAEPSRVHGVLKLRDLVQNDPDAGWRERYDAVGTEERP